MSKKWKPDPYRYLDKGWLKDFQTDQENKLNDRNWQPQKEADPPIGNEYAIPLEEMAEKS